LIGQVQIILQKIVIFGLKSWPRIPLASLYSGIMASYSGTVC